MTFRRSLARPHDHKGYIEHLSNNNVHQSHRKQCTNSHLRASLDVHQHLDLLMFSGGDHNGDILNQPAEAADCIRYPRMFRWALKTDPQAKERFSRRAAAAPDLARAELCICLL